VISRQNDDFTDKMVMSIQHDDFTNKNGDLKRNKGWYNGDIS
jgi:hypothetical protein